MPKQLRVAPEERRAQVAELLLARKTQREMARELGVRLATINEDVAAIRAEWRERRAVAITEHVARELAALDAAERAIWSQVAAGKLLAVDRLVTIQTRRAALLGLDAPTKVAPTTPDGDRPYQPLSLADLDRELAALLDAGRARAASRPDDGAAPSVGGARPA